MEIANSLESWSWVAGIFSALLAVVTLIWQYRISKQVNSRKGDWETMDQAFHGVRIGAPIRSLQKLNLIPIARDGSGDIKVSKWRLQNNNELSVTYDSAQDRILYVELDWSQKNDGIYVGIKDLVFGKTTLQDIRSKYKSNGFS